MKLIAACYDGRSLSRPDARALNVDCARKSVSILMVSVGFRFSLSCSKLSFAYVGPVIARCGRAIDILLLVLARHDDRRRIGRIESAVC